MTLTSSKERIITNTVVWQSRLVDTGSVQYKEVLERESKYMKRMLGVFGSKDVPKDEYAQFNPALTIVDGTTLENLKPALKDVLISGIEYWNALIKLAKSSLAGESQLALHERALGFLNDERSDTRSFKEVISLMSEMARMYSEDQKWDRIDKLYEKEIKKIPLWAGRLVYGKIGVLWNVGASQICDYQKAYADHSERVRDTALRGIN